MAITTPFSLEVASPHALYTWIVLDSYLTESTALAALHTYQTQNPTKQARLVRVIQQAVRAKPTYEIRS